MLTTYFKGFRKKKNVCVSSERDRDRKREAEKERWRE